VSELVRLQARVFGRVQGVGFRWFVRGEALRLELDGWVSNEADGSVRVIADGPRDSLETLLDALRSGPPASLVERVVVDWPPVATAASRAGRGFEIRSGAHRGD
jgi:acylphosphatase